LARRFHWKERYHQWSTFLRLEVEKTLQIFLLRGVESPRIFSPWSSGPPLLPDVLLHPLGDELGYVTDAG
jgi:hypothetical protein